MAKNDWLKKVGSFCFWLFLMAIPAGLCLFQNWYACIRTGWHPWTNGEIGAILYNLFTPARLYLSAVWTGALAILTIARPRLSVMPRIHRAIKLVAVVTGGLFTVLTVAMFVVYRSGLFSPTAVILQALALVKLTLIMVTLLLPDRYRKAKWILAVICTVLACANAVSTNITTFLIAGVVDIAAARYLINTLLIASCNGCIVFFALYPLKQRAESKAAAQPSL